MANITKTINFIVQTPTPTELWFWSYLLPISLIGLIIFFVYLAFMNRKKPRKMLAYWLSALITFIASELLYTVALGIWLSYAVMSAEIGLDYLGDSVAVAGYANLLWFYLRFFGQLIVLITFGVVLYYNLSWGRKKYKEAKR